MRRTISIIFLVLMLGFMSVSSAMAAAPFFHSATATINSSGTLVVSFDERGLGNDNVNYVLTADASATWACINRGGHNPSAANKRTVTAPIVVSQDFQPKNGRVVASISGGPLSAGDFSCPSGQNLVLASVSYTNIQLVDTTNNVAADVEPDSISRTLVNV